MSLGIFQAYLFSGSPEATEKNMSKIKGEIGLGGPLCGARKLVKCLETLYEDNEGDFMVGLKVCNSVLCNMFIRFLCYKLYVQHIFRIGKMQYKYYS